MAHSNKRISKRQHPEAICKQCNHPFTPTDARQKYCTPQHRIDYHNDKRKVEDKPYKDFSLIHKKNYKILVEIFNSAQYQKNQIVHENLLTHLGFKHNYYHTVGFNKESGQKVLQIKDYGIEFIGDVNKKMYKIHKIKS